ncbi:MAG TPA: MBL fold metallo-hydrolase, partial [Ktedonobacteraceae bacterium]|nr:MBL fold metallo-hydrolase [Ktedonobacteraceae bacterium]
EEIGPQLKQLDISPRDVRWLVLTHLHTDHAGGLYHFPGVETVVTRKEYQAARGFTGQLAGYLPQHWPDWFKPRLIDFSPEPFANFPRHMKLTSAGDVLLIPTPGHTSGHMSVLLLEGEQTICFAGDVSYSQDLFVRGKVDGISFNEGVARRTIEQLQTYTKNTPTVYLPSHDPASAERLAKREPIVYAESVLTGN